MGNEIAGSALRGLGMAYRELPEPPSAYSPEVVEQDMTLAGLVGIIDPRRREVTGAIRCCQDAGMRVIVITCDPLPSSFAIGREIGFIDGEASGCDGQGLEQLSNGELGGNWPTAARYLPAPHPG